MEEEVLAGRARATSSSARARRSARSSRAAASISLVGDPRRGAPRGVALEQRAELVEVVEVLRVVGAHDRAAVRRRVDEALGLEHQQRLADRRAADPELARELLLLQPRARLEPPVEDRLADQLRGGDAGVPDERVAVVEDPRHGGDHTVCNPAAPTRARRYRWPVDRDAIARAQRRRQAVEALEFERDRAMASREADRGARHGAQAPGSTRRRSRRWRRRTSSVVRAVLDPRPETSSTRGSSPRTSG